MRFDRGERGGEPIVVPRDVLLGGQNPPAEQTAKQGGENNRSRPKGQRRNDAHEGMLSDKPLSSNDFGLLGFAKRLDRRAKAFL